MANPLVTHVQLGSQTLDINDSRSLHYLEPSGDTSGEMDTTNIQTALDNGESIFLKEGTYYINSNIILRNYSRIEGSGINTILSCIEGVGFSINGALGASSIVLKNFQMTTNNGANKTALNFIGSVSTPYTGVRYAIMEDVTVQGFAVGMALRGCWSARFNRLRLIASSHALEMRGLNNNNIFTNCMFTNATIGLLSQADDGVNRNQGNVYIGCDFSSLTAFTINGDVETTIIAAYAEQTTSGFNLNSANQFSLKDSFFLGMGPITVQNTYYSTEEYQGYYIDITGNYFNGTGNLFTLANEGYEVVFSNNNIIGMTVPSDNRLATIIQTSEIQSSIRYSGGEYFYIKNLNNLLTCAVYAIVKETATTTTSSTLHIEIGGADFTASLAAGPYTAGQAINLTGSSLPTGDILQVHTYTGTDIGASIPISILIVMGGYK